VTVATLPLWDPDTFSRGFPHDLFRRLRAEDPVHWQPEPRGPGFWAVTRYDDVRTVSRHPELYSSQKRGVFLDEPSREELEQLNLMMLTKDPPEHTQLRKLVSTGFTPRMVGALEPHVREMAAATIDGFIDKGECDVVTECAAELPLLVIAELLGVPKDDRAFLFDLSNRLIGFDDPEYITSPEDAEIAMAEMFGYLHQLAAERQGTPARDDLIGVLMDAEVDGDRLTQLEIDLFFMLLVVAGNETTRNMISHALLALVEHPEQMARLRADIDGLLPTAVEEFLRWSPPVMHFRRTALADAVLGDQPIAADDKVIVYYPSANRDEAAFPAADTFDVGRDPNHHLGFGGGGPHFCLGANLARLEIRVMYEELLARVADIELTGEVRLLRSHFINGIKELPIRFRKV
jgi:cholest-4-en-3-one 26-monooxygenase